MKIRLSRRTRVFHYLIIFVIVLFSGSVVTAVLYLTDSQAQFSFITLLSIFLISGMAGGLLTYYIGKRILTPMAKLSRASQEVAHGNFNIQLKDPSRLLEVQTTFRNFNAMVKELDSIATLSNDFVANVSHEFKTPLTAIEGYAMLLQDDELPAEEREEYLEKILQNTHRLSSLVENILMLSKMESKALAEEFSLFRLDEQIRQAVVALEPQWAAKDLSFEVHLDELSINGCESLLPHVWSNLLSNAIKASSCGQCIHLSLLEQTECVVFSIRDEGCGMTEEVQARVFEKFYQADHSHKSEGYGLGLALAKRIVELSDGIIEVESAPDNGTTFRVILPK